MVMVGKNLVIVGSIIIVVGLLLMVEPKIPFLGKLPGDIHIKKENFELYIPIITCIILSIILSGVFWFVSHVGKK
jgi:hypothetical protein